MRQLKFILIASLFSVFSAPSLAQINADLSVLVDSAPNPSMVGQAITYTVTVSNAGADEAEAVELSASRNFGVLGTITPTQGTCTTSADALTITCAFGNLAANAMASVSYQVTPTQSGDLTTTAQVSATTADADVDNNMFEQHTPVRQPTDADLSLSQTDSPDPVEVGKTLSYSFTVRNAGPAAASGVLITDTLPDSVTFVDGQSTAGCSANGQTIQCGLGVVPAQGTGVAVINVLPNTVATISNRATVSATQNDPVPADNESSETTVVMASTDADVLISVTDTPDPAVEQQSILFEVVVENSGPADAQDVAFSVTRTAGALIAESLSVSQGSCGATALQIDCTIGTLVNQRSATLSYQVTADASFETMAVVQSSNDPNAANNTVTENTTVSAVDAADLSLQMLSEPQSVEVEDTFLVQAQINNAGPSVANGVVLSLTLPAGLQFIEGQNCVGDGSQVECTFISVASGQMQPASIDLQAVSAGSYSLPVSVTAEEPDPNSSNNSGAFSVDVVRGEQADISVTLVDAPDPVAAGGTVRYTADVRNLGARSADNVNLVLTRTEGVVIAITPSQGTCAADNADPLIQRCALGSVAASAQSLVTLDITPLSTTGTLTLGAQVSHDRSDLRDDNNSDSEDTLIVSPSDADLELTIIDTPDPVLIGETLRYRLIVNNRGPNVSTGALVTDMLPPEAILLAAESTAGCTVDGQTVSCGLGVIPAGTSAEAVLDVVTGDAIVLINKASVTGVENDPRTENNSAESSTIAGFFDMLARLVDTAEQATEVKPGETHLAHQIKFVSAGGEVSISALRFSAGGGGDDAADIESVTLVHDINENGSVDSEDLVLGSGVWAVDNGELRFELLSPVIVDAETPASILLVYQFKPASSTVALGAGVFVLAMLGTGMRRRWLILVAILLLVNACGDTTTSDQPGLTIYRTNLIEVEAKVTASGRDAFTGGVPLPGIELRRRND